MPRTTRVDQVMTTEVLTFTPEQNVQEAMSALIDRGVDGAPVVDGHGRVVGILSTGDLIVQESRLHWPTVISLLGASLELPSSQRHFEHDLAKALGSEVHEVMDDDPITVGPADSLETAATLLHDKEVSRLPVVDDDRRLVGIVARADILRSIIGDYAEGEGEPEAETADPEPVASTEAGHGD